MKRVMLCAAMVLALLPLSQVAGHAATGNGIQYVTVDDGTEIAVQVFLPSGYDPAKTYPTLVEAEGYGGASSPNDPTFVGNPNYVVVAVSLRGTGCSGGQLDLFSERSSKDVAWVIDHWIPGQSWSNGDVGIYGHSYGGLTGFLVAEQNPSHLRAVAVSGLIDDFYRGILYPGGVLNEGFPLLWGALLRPISEHSSNASVMSDPHCLANYAQHEGSDAAPPPSLATDTYGSPYTKDPVTGQDAWAIQRALLSHVDDIHVPIQLGQQYQDEQTGPRGGHVLWENLPSNVPKRISISTGMHNPNDPTGTKKDWLDCWILNKGYAPGNPAQGTFSQQGRACNDVMDPAQRVLLFFESEGADRLAPYVTSDWPLPAGQVTWKHVQLCADSTLAETPGAGCDGTVSYASTGTGRHTTENFGHAVGGLPYDKLAPYGFTTGLPDTARYTMTNHGPDPFTIAGPIDLTLYASATSADVDFWAEILDRAPNGDTVFVQRGLLRASFAAQFEPSKSQYTQGGDLYRPYYDYTATTPITPGTVNKYEIEVFPLGHAWRPGHQLILQLHAPPANDPISTYAYEPNQASVVTIVHDAAHPSSILLPFMNSNPPLRDTQPPCGAVVGEGCITPSLG